MQTNHVNDFTDSLLEYYKSLKNYQPLSKEEEQALFKEYKAGSSEARDKIIKSNLKFAFNVAKNYSGRGVSMQDLVSEANMGLIEAMDKYDETKGFKFISYAVWYIKSNLVAVINDAKENMNSEMKAGCSNEGEMDGALIDPEDDMPSPIEAPSAPEIGSVTVDKEEQENFTVSLLEALNDNEKNIISRLYGINGHEVTSLQDIGYEMHVTSERVRQIKIGAIRKMRAHALLSDKVPEGIF